MCSGVDSWLPVIFCFVAGISIVDADITTDIVEPADFNRFVSRSLLQSWYEYSVVINVP